MRTRCIGIGMCVLNAFSGGILWGWNAEAAGTLKPANASYAPMEILEHHVHVVLNNGFARTEVQQTFHNPNADAVDAVYEFPVPRDAALSEMDIEVGERTLHGEVTGLDQAQAIYQEQRAAGATAGLATKDGYQTFRFDVSQVPAGRDARMTFVYYEPLLIDTAVGRYLYPLQDGGTRDEAAASFWTRNEQVTSAFSFDLELKSAAPVEELRLPGHEGAKTEQLGSGHYRVHLDSAGATLDQDVVCYYRLKDDLPGRVEVIPFRRREGGTGTFMMVLTPGVDLAPITVGRDLVFVLDVSGSMDTKLHTLTAAVGEALATLAPEDRFRVVTFSDSPRDLLGGFQTVTAAHVSAAVSAVEALAVQGGTNLYAGLGAGLDGLDADRISGVVLVTDGVANEGLVAPIAFDALMRKADVRVFGMLLGNNANWPLMDLITDVSGGFYAGVSNQDDILGQVLLANSKISHESLRDARLSLSGPSGTAVHDTTDFDFGKVYRGQQLVVFGQYDAPGTVAMRLDARVSGKTQAYETNFAFPEVDEDNPELERLWALDMIHAIERQRMLGLLPGAEAAQGIRDLGIKYQLVTDETAMLVVDDSVYTENGIDRSNQSRTADERAAQVRRDAAPAVDYRVDQTQPAFGGAAPSLGSGSGSGNASGSGSGGTDRYGGALDPATSGLGILLALYGIARRRRGELQ